LQIQSPINAEIGDGRNKVAEIRPSQLPVG
jgi:hypothetical protein